MRASDGTLRPNALSAPPRRQEQARAVPKPSARDAWLGLWQRRRQPTTYHRCLAIHIHFAGPRSALS